MTATLSEQINLLLQPPAPKSLSEKDGFTYVGHQYIRVSLNRIFGFGNWSFTVDKAECLHEGKVARKQGGENWNITYRVTGTLVVTFVDGTSASYTEVAVDSSFHPQYDQCHDHAVKGAASSSLRRASMNLGSVFGLGLYFPDPSHPRSAYKGEVVRGTIQTEATPGAQPVSTPPEGGGEGQGVSEAPGAAQRPDLNTPEGVAQAIDDLKATSTPVDDETADPNGWDL